MHGDIYSKVYKILRTSASEHFDNKVNYKFQMWCVRSLDSQRIEEFVFC